MVAWLYFRGWRRNNADDTLELGAHVAELAPAERENRTHVQGSKPGASELAGRECGAA